MGGISIWQLLIVLVIIMLLFGTKKLRNIGADLGGAVKGFKKAMTDEEKQKALELEQQENKGQVIDAKAEQTEQSQNKPKA